MLEFSNQDFTTVIIQISQWVITTMPDVNKKYKSLRI